MEYLADEILLRVFRGLPIGLGQREVEGGELMVKEGNPKLQAATTRHLLTDRETDGQTGRPTGEFGRN